MMYKTYKIYIQKYKLLFMYLKKCWKYTIYILILIGVILTFFLKISTPINLNNQASPLISIGLKIHDIGALVALIVGILSFFGTIYTVDRNYKAMKLSSIPEKSVNLLIDLEFTFNEFEDEDKLILLTEILKYWKNHQKAFRLLTPNFYKNFLKIISNNDKIKNNDSIPNINSKYVLCAIKAQISDIAFENDECIFSFIEPQLIQDDENLKFIGENIKNYTEIRKEKNVFEKYINNFRGKKTRKITLEKFKKFNHDIECLLRDLKLEISEYD